MIEFTGDGYPTEDCLEVIREWSPPDLAEGYNHLLEDIREVWRYESYIIRMEVAAGTRWEISTGGWSGHEDVIEALQQNRLFWSFCWWESRRGGHYVFIVPRERQEVGR